MSRDAQRKTRNAQRRVHATRRAQYRVKSVAQSKKDSACKRVRTRKDLGVQDQKNEGRLPHAQHVQIRPEEHDRRMLDTHQ